MIEYGSDFHSIQSINKFGSINEYMPSNAILLASGRQCLISLINQNKWKRIWLPQYFCYEVIDAIIKDTDITVAFYEDFPAYEKKRDTITYLDGDVLFRVNYFGLKKKQSWPMLPIPVIEDHTHDLLGEWASNSVADWCIASLRKTLPIPEGGVLWSPKGYILDTYIVDTRENEFLAERRWKAMDLKSKYLSGEFHNKDTFRKLYLDTEDEFEHLKISSIDTRSMSFLSIFDTQGWYDAKERNWKLLRELIRGDFELIEPETENCNVFSFIMLFPDRTRRDDVRKKLIAESVYPTILWNTPKNVSKEVKCFSERMLSIHCDGRYTEEDIRDLALRINRVLAL